MLAKTKPPQMTSPFRSKRGIRAALGKQAYAADKVRICDPDLRGYECLVASRQGLFAVNRQGAKYVAHGFFFGLRRHGDSIFIFESCDMPQNESRMGRIVRLRVDAGRITDSAVLVKGLDNQCHQIAVIDERICVVDTANQSIPRFTLEGVAVDVKHPFPRVARGDTSEHYLHINSIARVRGHIAILLHNGMGASRVPSELAWLNDDWEVVRREPLAGYGCHDILEDHRGVVWHCGSLDGELLNSAGAPIRVSGRMTRGLAFGRNGPIVGASIFSVRELRDEIAGSVIFLDAEMGQLDEIQLPAAPTDLIAL